MAPAERAPELLPPARASGPAEVRLPSGCGTPFATGVSASTAATWCDSVKILGHSEVSTTMKYLHLVTADLQAPHQRLSILNRLR